MGKACEMRGVVTVLDGTKALVEIIRLQSCSDCVAGCLIKPRSEERPQICAENSIAAQVGDTVVVIPEMAHYVKGVFVVFVVPVLAMIAGYWAGTVVGALREISSSAGAYIGMGCGFIVSLVLIHVYGERNPVRYRIERDRRGE